MTQKIAKPVGQPAATPSGLKPDLRPLDGKYTTLEPLAVAHASDLWEGHEADADGGSWTYMWNDPLPNKQAFADMIAQRATQRDPWFYAYIRKATTKAVGMGAFMRMDAANGVVEIGHIWMSPALQRTREATEAIFLMMCHAFDDLKVRRLEWKCDSLNGPSRRAAERFGFTFEGIFRQHLVYKGRNRDTAWYSVIDSEWPRIKAGFEAWLQASNFDAQGQQKAKLRLG